MVLFLERHTCHTDQCFCGITVLGNDDLADYMMVGIPDVKG
jgi:hypothetical protein